MCETEKLDQVGAGRQVRSVTSVRRCRVCGCTEIDCSQCIELTGVACHWVETDLCSRCQAEEALVKGQPTAWNYLQAIKAIAAAEVQRDIVFNGIRRILTCGLTGEAVTEELHHIHASAIAIGPGEITQRLAVVLKMFLDDNDFRQAGTGIDKEDSDEIKETRTLLELLT